MATRHSKSGSKFACSYGFIIKDYNILVEYCARHNLKNPISKEKAGTKWGTQRLLMFTIIPDLLQQLALQPDDSTLSTGIVEPIPTHPHPDLDENYQIQNFRLVIRFCKWSGKHSPTTEELDLYSSQNRNGIPRPQAIRSAADVLSAAPNVGIFCHCCNGELGFYNLLRILTSQVLLRYRMISTTTFRHKCGQSPHCVQVS
ncbi:hypothetical protein C8Q78DRAFT_608754 [Trametes maxima]|nr:hypothetical protein C8Q78DRAFT_608754 [Trametes maxima]